MTWIVYMCRLPYPVQRLYPDKLVETRLANLENEVRLLKRQNRGNSKHEQDDENDAITSDSTRSDVVAHGELDETHASPDATDGIGSIEFMDENDSAYFGPSSNITFMRKIRRGLTFVLKDRSIQLDPVPRRSRSPPPASLAISRPQSPRSRPSDPHPNGTSMADSLSLPSPAEARTLVETYFATTGVLFPFVHKATFMDTFEQARRANFRTLRRSWLALLNIILAMATTIESTLFISASDRAARAEVFFARSEALCIKLTMSGTTLETVQTLLLMGLYLQGTNRSVKTWNIHGLAVKAAFHLGLHSNDFSRKFSAIDREIRARTWFGCIVLDRTLSMTFGRPSAIPDNYIRIPLPEGLGFSSSKDIEQEDSEALSTVFFNETIKLYKIMWLVLESLYESNIGSQGGTGMLTMTSDILRVEQQFMEWQSSLNPALTLITAKHLSTDEEEYSLSKRLRVILSLRYHNLCILASRPFLDFYLHRMERREPDDPETSMILQLGSRYCRTCFESATNLIDLIHTIFHSSKLSRKLLGAWWFTFYYTFNATLAIAVVMLIDRVCGSENQSISGIPEATLKESLDKAIDCLPLVDPGNQMVSKCTQVASTIRRYLELLASSNGLNEQPMVSGTIAVEAVDVDGIDAAVVEFPIDPSHIGLDWFHQGFNPELQSDVVGGLYDMDLFC
ncbi:hypothetical protein PFICI_05579 [Pestalotiopsis fici W106-1]|uniref:Xylanolytic transcriptional activator regulatory domain-containing protein n=1 Tax=Pestalotiopsis fici (strain W106-1 / CGMCC3.15140) TaxID=1229662 RepID=W3XC87_PESFW|nr:uncharacterized protein PFICI_05579 [Pestalotiopsis fici W106-1]ETS83703.1 hypothetical protein PFICI_05579 [Pestalotiopsis fici W106-1]